MKINVRYLFFFLIATSISSGIHCQVQKIPSKVFLTCTGFSSSAYQKLQEHDAVTGENFMSEKNNYNELNPAPQAIGGSYGGGIIAWTDPSGKHGIIAARQDSPGKGFAWNPDAEKVTGSVSEEIYGGITNTETIIKVQGVKSNHAAKYCQEMSVTENGKTYDDWYLPSKQELALLFKNRSLIGGFNTTNGIYWSSTESVNFPSTMAWEQEFKYGTQLEDDKDLPNQIRCIRKF